MKHFIVILLCTILLSFPIANANCKPNPQTTVEMVECAERDYKKADTQLNKAYKDIIKGLKGQYKKNMIQAELAWIQYRDKNCTYESALYEGGTMRPLIGLGCMTRMTKARTQELLLQHNN